MAEEVVMAKDNFEKVPEQPVEEPKEGKKKSKLRKIIDWVITGLFGAVLACSIGFSIYANVNKGNAFILDYVFPVVLTDSMCPDYKVNSVLVVKKVNPADINVDDDIMFYYDFEDGNGVVKVTHRIISAEPSTDPTKGEFEFIAHGINKKSEFCGHYEKESNEFVYEDCTNQTQTFNEKDVIGKVVGQSRLLGFFYTIVSSTWGLILIILIPALYLIITSVVDIFKKLPDDDEETPQLVTAGAGASGGTGASIKPVTRADGSDPLAGLTPEEKEKLKKQLLEQMLKGKGGKK